MGIWKRLGTLLKANINDLISKAEDPEKILNQLIIDMQDGLVEARKHVAVAIADEKRLRKQLDNEVDLAKEWEKKAMMAIRAGRDDLAKEALARQSEHANLGAEFQKQWELQKNATDKLQSSLRLLNSKIEEAKRKKDLLIARKKRAEAQKRIQETMGNLADNTGAFDAFDRMAKKIEEEEAQVEAAAELAGQGGDDLAKKFEQLQMDHGVDDQLLALKAKMGLVAPAAPAPAAEVSAEEIDFEELEKAVAISAKRTGQP